MFDDWHASWTPGLLAPGLPTDADPQREWWWLKQAPDIQVGNLLLAPAQPIPVPVSVDTSGVKREEEYVSSSFLPFIPPFPIIISAKQTNKHTKNLVAIIEVQLIWYQTVKLLSESQIIHKNASLKMINAAGSVKGQWVLT